MATWYVHGLDELIKKMNRLEVDCTLAIEKSLYEGAGVMANAVKSELNAIPIDNRVVHGGEIKRGPSQIEKNGLQSSFGIAHFRHNLGTIDTSLGFDGRSSLITKRWPSGKPNAVIAREVNSGTSYMQKNPFMARARRKGKQACEAKMKQTFEKEIEKIIG